MMSIDQYRHKRERTLASLRGTAGLPPLALVKTTSNLFRHRDQNRVHRLDLSDFNQVLRVDEKEACAEVEGLTTYEDLVRETLPFNLMPAVVPQLKTITVGGAIAGIGIESSSFRYGFVHETMLELEILLPDGNVVVATRENEHSDLFLGFPNSYGTLGYALRAVVKLVPAKRFVKLTHHRYSDLEQYFRGIAQVCEARSVDFIDGTMFHESELYITTGEFVDRAEWVSDYTYRQIYYQSIQQRQTDYLTTHDYLWRWDTDWFWCSKHFFLQYPVMRRLWGKHRLRSAVYWKLWKRFHHSRAAQLIARTIEGRQEAVIQDVEIPIERAPEFAGFLHRNIGIKPVWVCPVRTYDPSVLYSLYSMDPKQLYVNFGFWDVVKSDREEGYFNRAVEAKVRECAGRKSLYSSSYYSREEFGRLYNEPAYRRLKMRYDSTGRLTELYDKCVLKK
ncbi:MAG: FAD-binding oxidoreductase [Nitrospiraceae bacterium]